MSGSIVLDLNYLEQMKESYSTEAALCDYSSLEFTQSFQSFRAYSEQDSNSIALGFSATKLLAFGSAFGSLSTTRTDTRSTARSAQYYIYDLQLMCIKARVSIHGYDKLWWNINFLNTLRILPRSYNDGDDLGDFIEFWETYGTHIVKSAELGGMIEGSVVANKCTVEKSFESIEGYKACLNGAFKGVVGVGGVSGVRGGVCHGDSDGTAQANSAESAIESKRIVVKG